MRQIATGPLLVFMTASLLLQLSCRQTNQVPDAPATPGGPESGYLGGNGAFSASSTDPDGDSLTIRFDWGTGDTSVWSSPVQPGDTVTMSYTWPVVGILRVRAQAKDVHDGMSGWSSPHWVNVTQWPNRAPAVPAAPAGPKGSYLDSTCDVVAAAVDPDGDSVAIRFDWGNDDTSDWSGWVASGAAVAVSRLFNLPGICSIRAQAKDAVGFMSGWSAACSIRVAPKPQMLWRFDAGTNVTGSPAIDADGTIYFMSEGLCALNPDATVKWRCPTVRGRYPVLDADGTVYCVRDQTFYAVSASGVLKWSYEAGSYLCPPAVGHDGTIYFGAGDDGVYALNPDSTLKWHFAVANGAGELVLGEDGTIYCASNGCIYAISDSGIQRWCCLTETGWLYSLAIGADGTIYAGSEGGYVHAVNLDGTPKWRYRTASAVRSAPAVAADGTIYVGSCDRCLYALRPDGSLKWRYRTDGLVYSSPTVAEDGTVYVGSYDCYICALDAEGRLKWHFKAGGRTETDPAIGANGVVILGSEDEHLYAVQGSAPLANSPWPKHHHDARNTGRFGGP